jgi:preprotein translocase subunit SecD
VSDNSISATLGSQQLQIGLIAGLIGLALVALYSLIVYRALGFVIIASLGVMGCSPTSRCASWRGAWASACRWPASRV